MRALFTGEPVDHDYCRTISELVWRAVAPSEDAPTANSQPALPIVVDDVDVGSGVHCRMIGGFRWVKPVNGSSTAAAEPGEGGWTAGPCRAAIGWLQ